MPARPGNRENSTALLASPVTAAGPAWMRAAPGCGCAHWP